MGSRHIGPQPADLRFTVRPSSGQDALELAPRLRDIDVEEIAACSGRTPLESLEFGLAHSDECFTVTYMGAPAVMFGVSREGDQGIIWALASEELEEFPRQFARYSRPWVQYLGRGLTSMHNVVLASNRVHRRWLEWCGATFGSEAPIGLQGQSLIPFSISCVN